MAIAMQQRINTHLELATKLSLLSDVKLTTMLKRAELSRGWGQNGTLEFDGKKLFVKMIPLTNLEVENAYSTKNLFRIPAWYNYGVGSAGFGAFRELATSVKATNWVLSGECQSFPLLCHHRILKIAAASKVTEEEITSYTKSWNHSKAVGNYIRERSRCEYHLVLFYESLQPFADWIIGHQDKLSQMFGKAIKTAEFMQSRGMIHFDAHIQNWLTDGKQVFLCDFGLALDQDFDLTDLEREFFNNHRNYDFAQIISTVADGVLLSYFSLPSEQQLKINEKLGRSPDNFPLFLSALARGALSLDQAKLLSLPASLKKHIEQYQPIIDLKHQFLERIRTGKKATNLYPAKALNRHLAKLKIT